MSKKIVIIGAGQTGRGFIAPFIENNNYEYCFIDKDKHLVNRLRKIQSYNVFYYNNERRNLTIDNINIFHNDSPDASEAISEADIVITAIGSDNIKELVPLLNNSIQLRKKDSDLTIILCENGVHVKQPLTSANIDAHITEAIIFATTLQPASDSLDLYTENYPNIPYDSRVGDLNVNIDGFIAEKNFASLIKRKIYTYNFLSAVISYIGYYKGYTYLSEAANDTEIDYIMKNSIESLNKSITKEFSLAFEEQKKFSDLAIKKFKNKEIIDTIDRNTRDIVRKLGPIERLTMPLKMGVRHKESTKYILLTIAAAMFYGVHEEDLKIGHIPKIMGIDNNSDLMKQLLKNYEMFNQDWQLSEIIETINTL